MQFGPWDVQIVSGGTFRLDGGAMFGTVPKVVWNKLYPADEENQILMATNCLLIRGEVDGKKHVILVDNGNGDKESDDFMARFKFEGRGVLDANLAKHGVKPADITLCILTHLHFDHAGGSTRFDANGKPVPSFPNARYVVQAKDLADAKHPHLRVKASYLPQNWEPLEAAGLLETVDGIAELLPGISVRPAPGHIEGLQNVIVEGGGKRLVYLADLIPTARHIQPAWCMGYDLDVVTCVNERQKLLDEVTGTDTVCVFEHDPEFPAGTVSRDAKGKYVVAPVQV
ncbi:MAG TPA: MBL fold metallo-hydrolase [Geothrix sp.]|uniref:MBL fold metallo-hydrolase n=1 Tax=Geothrix mesophila TaxID=2922723 RepID=UPI001FADD627|nr:MBL fold metallo-hydrolase [Geothrix sp. SG198]HJV37647.1 MBL fold metallo-hydrolase [Geothrix sp.]